MSIERDVVLIGKDADGNETMDMPITRLGNVEDGASIKEMPESGDYMPIIDGADNGQMKKMPWVALKETLSDAIYGTYAQLKTIKDNNQLVIGRSYVLTGYKTKYQQPTTNVIKETSINDNGESLVLTAIGVNEFSPVCNSLDFQIGRAHV